MTQSHPISPPPAKLLERWVAETWHDSESMRNVHIATRAASWGYNAKTEEIRRWFRKNSLEDMTSAMLQNCHAVLNELQGARDLAVHGGHDPGEVSGPYLEMLLQICRDHVALEQIHEASAD